RLSGHRPGRRSPREAAILGQPPGGVNSASSKFTAPKRACVVHGGSARRRVRAPSRTQALKDAFPEQSGFRRAPARRVGAGGLGYSVQELSMRIYEKRFDLDLSAPESRPQFIELQLASGSAVRVAAIKLYDRRAVEELAEMRVAAFALLTDDAGALPAREDWAVTPAVLVNAINRRIPPRRAQEA